MKKIIALAGTPNCGKTTLFNQISKSHGAVGNRPGVTVEKKYGALRSDPDFAVVDLPGTYSLASKKAEERLTGEFLTGGGADCVITVIDGAHPEHGLCLLLEILSIGAQAVAAINFADELKRSGGAVDLAALSKKLGIPCFLISAKDKTGLSPLLAAARSAACGKRLRRFAPLTAEKRLLAAEELCKSCFSLKAASPFSEKLDRFFTESRFSFFVCASSMLTVLILAFGFPASALAELTESFFGICSALLFNFLSTAGLSESAAGLVAYGALGSFGKVISFLPQLALVFLFISFLEESGYLARAAFVLDKLLRRLGLGGFAVIPLLLGLGCTVPAMLSAKSAAPDERRRITLALPFVPCSAKLPVYSYFAGGFFDKSPWLFVACVYTFSLLLGAVYCFFTKGKEHGFLLELPPLRMPSAKNIIEETFIRCQSFVVKASTVITASGIIIWLFSHLNANFLPLSEPSESVLYAFGTAVRPFFAPVGLEKEAVIALICGVFAKEACLSVLLQLGGSFSLLSALSFIIFFTVYTPCIAALTSIWQQNGAKTAVRIFVFQTALAYALSFLFYQTASAFLVLIR